MWILRETSYELDEIPAPFGWFHLVFLFLTMIVLAISLIKIKKLQLFTKETKICSNKVVEEYKSGKINTYLFE